MPSYDDYVDEGGGLLTAFTGPTADAYFTDGQYGTQLEIHVQIANPEDHPNIPFGIVKNWFGTGPGWKPVKNGAAVEHESGPDKKFNNNTDMGRLLKQIQAVDTDMVLLAAGTPYEAAFYKAIQAEWGPVSWTTGAFTGRDGSEVPAKTKSKSMPVKLLGGAATNGHAVFDIASLALPEATLAILRGVAEAAKDYAAFVAGCVPVVGGQPVMQSVGDSKVGPQIYEALSLI